MTKRRFAWCWCLVALIALMGPIGGAASLPTSGDGLVATPSSGLVVDATPNPGGWGNIILDIAASGPRDAWAVGVQATYTSNDTLAIHWNGTSWTAVPTPNPESDCEDGDILWGGQTLSGVSGVSPTDVWAVGSGCYGISPLIEHWNGTSWSLVSGPAPKVAGGDSWASLGDVAAIASSNVWAVGYRGSSGEEPLIEHWNGGSWAEIAAPNPGDAYLTSISATGPNDIWVVGGSDPHSNLIEHFNGTGWTIVPSPQPALGSSLDSVSAVSPTNAWAVGSKWGPTGAELTFVLHWNGTAWTQLPSPNPSSASSARNQLRSVAVVSSTDVWAFGMYENEQTNYHQHRTLALHSNGFEWRLFQSPQPGRTSQLTAAAALPAGSSLPGKRIWAAGLFSNYDRNIYDGHYTLPETLVAHR